MYFYRMGFNEENNQDTPFTRFPEDPSVAFQDVFWKRNGSGSYGRKILVPESDVLRREVDEAARSFLSEVEKNGGEKKLQSIPLGNPNHPYDPVIFFLEAVKAMDGSGREKPQPLSEFKVYKLNQEDDFPFGVEKDTFKVSHQNNHQNGLWEVKGFVGSPLQIALYLKRYDEAKAILERRPMSVSYIYATLPVTVRVRVREEDDEIIAMTDQGIYLEELVLTDPDIPDELFVKLCQKLSERKGMNDIERPNRCFIDITKDCGKNAFVPNLILDLPLETVNLFRKNNLQFCGRFNWMNGEGILERLSHIDIPQENRSAGLEAVDRDLERLWKVLAGLRRLKELDNELFCSYVDERTVAFLPLLLFFLGAAYASFMAMSGDIFGRNILLKDFSDFPESFHGKEQIQKLRDALDGLEIKRVDPKFLIEAADAWSQVGGCRMDCLDSLIEIWKELFQEKLILTLGDDMPNVTESLLTEIFHLEDCDEEYDVPDEQYHPFLQGDQIKRAKRFLRFLDNVSWSGTAFQEKRLECGELVAYSKDYELMILCLEKNIFPAEDMTEMFERVKESKQQRMLPLVILKRHNAWG